MRVMAIEAHVGAAVGATVELFNLASGKGIAEAT